MRRCGYAAYEVRAQKREEQDLGDGQCYRNDDDNHFDYNSQYKP
ncbi:hypothetical protein [Xenorhabdus nematophila]